MSNPKGTFKYLPLEQQPERIPLVLIPALEKFIVEEFGHLGDCYFPNALKKSKEETTGDLDVIFVPKCTTWKTEILGKLIVIAHVNNGKQLMTVMENCLGNGKRYMIDFLITRQNELRFKTLFYSYGTMFSAILGSFARSIGYKFTDTALWRRVKTNHGQWRNYWLTNNPKCALTILGLDSDFIYDDAIYTSEGIASWIVSSSRFDSVLWNNGSPDHIAVGIPINKNARDAIKKKSEVCDAYDLICLTDKQSIYPPGIDTFEVQQLGAPFVERMRQKINEVKVNSTLILSGHEIMEVLKIPPGPMIGKIQQYISEHWKDMSETDKKSDILKKAAKRLILRFKDVRMVSEICS